MESFRIKLCKTAFVFIMLIVPEGQPEADAKYIYERYISRWW